MAEPKVINVYGLPIDWRPPTKEEYHGSTYLEYSIPEELEGELSKMIEKRLNKFYKSCPCQDCKKNRKDG